MTLTEQLNVKYAEGLFAVVCTNEVIIPVRNRSMIRAAKDGRGCYIQRGKKEIYVFVYQIKFAKMA